MKIGIDIDNVIAQTFNDLFRAFKDYMGRELKPEEVVETMRREKFRMWGYWYLTWRKQLLTQVSLVRGAREVLLDCYEEHEIHLVTSRLPIMNRQTKKWLKQHDIPYHGLHHAKELSKHTKVTGCEIFIEDNLEECEVLSQYCEKVLLFDHPWNRRPLRGKNIIRVSDWSEIRSQILR